MHSTILTRRQMPALAGSALAVAALGSDAFAAPPQTGHIEAEISHANAAIHQEVVFAASASRLYRTLTDTAEFDKVVQQSAAMTTQMKSKLGNTPTAIDARPGGSFVLFGGYITGHTLELVADRRIVQAWRAGSWDEGIHSIARFELVAEGKGARIVFDHTGFPNAAAAHLAEGWHINYWQPLAKVLGS